MTDEQQETGKEPRRPLILSLYISIPVYICVHLMSNYLFIYFPQTYIPVFRYIYFPSYILLIYQSGNPHTADPVLYVIVPFVQTFLMVFAAVLIVRKLRRTGP